MSETIAVETGVAFTGAARAVASKRYPWTSLTTPTDLSTGKWGDSFFVPAKADGTLRRPVAPDNGKAYTMRAVEENGQRGVRVGYVGAKQPKASKVQGAQLTTTPPTIEDTGF